LPPEDTNKGWNRKLYLHTDQSFLKNDFHCVQSWITALDVNEGDATLAFLEKSHKFHAEMGQVFNLKQKEDWFKLENQHETFCQQKGCPLVKIKCPKGSLVLWDSRTIHCGVEPIKGRLKPNLRCVIYLCYIPRMKFSNKDLEKKRNWFNELRTCGHSGKVFPKTPRTYGGEVPNITHIDKPVLTDLGRKLVGF
jgi:hypothetical protein